MTLVEDQHEVKTLGSGWLDPALGNGVGARRSEGGPELHDAEVVQAPIEHTPVATVAVMDEKARWFEIPAAAFDDLLRHPFGCGIASNPDMQDLAVGMTDRKEDIVGLKPDRPHTEEITGPDILRMSLEKLPPAW